MIYCFSRKAREQFTILKCAKYFHVLGTRTSPNKQAAEIRCFIPGRLSPTPCLCLPIAHSNTFQGRRQQIGSPAGTWSVRHHMAVIYSSEMVIDTNTWRKYAFPNAILNTLYLLLVLNFFHSVFIKKKMLNQDHTDL